MSTWAYAMCIQVPRKTRRGHWVSWSWSYRLLWAAYNVCWEWRDISTLDCWAISPNPTPPYVYRNRTFIKHWSKHSRESTLYSISLRKYVIFYPFWGGTSVVCFYALNVKIQSPTQMPPAPGTFYLCRNWSVHSQSHSSQRLMFIKLCFIKILFLVYVLPKWAL